MSKCNAQVQTKHFLSDSSYQGYKRGSSLSLFRFRECTLFSGVFFVPRRRGARTKNALAMLTAGDVVVNSSGVDRGHFQAKINSGWEFE